MSWSHNKSGKALEVAREIEKEGAMVQSYLQGAEKSLHARVLALITCSCHEMKHGHVKVSSNGHAEYIYNEGVDTGLRNQRLNLSIEPMAAPVEEPKVLEVQEHAAVEAPVVEEVKAPVEEPIVPAKKERKSKAKVTPTA